MGRYAANTEVSVESSRADVEHTIRRYGATEFCYGWQDSRAMIGFSMAGRRVKFVLPLPPREDFARTSGRGLLRSQRDQMRLQEQAWRQRWRALGLVIKAKLEAVESGIAQFEEEFMAYVVLPDGHTVAEYVTPAIANAYETGTVPALLPWHGRNGS